MLIKIPSRSDCSESEVTSETLYLSRRRLLGASFAGLALASANPAKEAPSRRRRDRQRVSDV
ncbi:protein-methionine-sulfoxide reductase catalytic subunit MsrP, partial [Pseudomonas aeruginosa]